MSNILVVAHKFLHQPDDDLVLFLNNKKTENVMHIMHEFPDAQTRFSICRWYKNGVLEHEWKTKDCINFPEPLLYVKEFISTIYWVIKSGISWDKYIGMDGLCVLFGIVLRLITKVRSVIYWAIDFVPQNRFKQIWKNRIYQFINITSYKKAEEVWDLSPRMSEAREKYLGLKKSDYKAWKLVPYGVWVDRIRRYSFEDCEKNTLVFMGHLLEKQGVQIVIKAIPEIIKVIPSFKFKIIGGGNYKEELVKLSKEIGVEKYCDFKGKIESDTELEDEIAKSCVAVAPYIKELDTWTYYADPGKIKKYIACGVPVILTYIPWNASDIANNKCGIIVDVSNLENLVSNITYLMDGIINSEYRSNCLKYSQFFDYTKIFSSLKL